MIPAKLVPQCFHMAVLLADISTFQSIDLLATHGSWSITPN